MGDPYGLIAELAPGPDPVAVADGLAVGDLGMFGAGIDLRAENQRNIGLGG